MNFIEQQMQLGRQMMEHNTTWLKSFAEFDAASAQKFVETNQEFAKRLPELNDLQSMMELQREYAETMWNNSQELMRSRTEMMQEAAEAQTELLRSAFTVPEQADKAPTKATSKRQSRRKAA